MQVARLLARPVLSLGTASSSIRSSFVGGNFNPIQAGLRSHCCYQFLSSTVWGRQLHLTLPKALHLVCYPPVWRFPSKALIGLAAATGCTSLSSGSAKVVECEGDQKAKFSIPSVQENHNDWDEGQSPLLIWMRRLWVPMLVVMTVAMGWHYPVSLTVNLVFLLWSTKPTPSSVYIWVEQKRIQAAQHKYGLDRLKAQLSTASTVMHVEVRDYMLFCVAQISSLTQKDVVLGLLGDWWVVYSSSSSITGINFGSWFPVSPPNQW